MLRISAITILTLLILSCEGTESIKQTYEQARKQIDDITPTSDEVTQGTQAEIEKLTTIEYKVHTVAATTSPEEVEESLKEIGRKRWNCFHVEKRNTDLLFFCSRRPKTYLRYVTRFLNVPDP